MRSVLRASGALGVLALLAGTASAQQGAPPRAVGREIVNWDFRPDGGFRKVTRARQAIRRAAMARGDVQALNGSGAPAVTGTFDIPVLFLQYSDSAATGIMADTTNFHSTFFSADPMADPLPRPYSLKTYYDQLSNGQITMTGDLFQWITTPFTFAFVGSGCGAIYCNTGQSHLFSMLKAGLDSLNSVAHQVDWNKYDSDHDGFVDFVTFVLPTLGAECFGVQPAVVNNVWAHRYVLNGLVGGSIYNTKSAWTGHPGQFVRIADYVLQGAQGGNNCTSGQIMPVGTVAHETGHAFGIPDLYCANNCSTGSEGVGEWSLMGSGNYTMPYSPAAWDAWSLASVGWVSVDTLNGSKTVTLNPVQTSDTVLIAPINGTDQYFLLENRAFLQSDTAQMRLGRPTTGQGGQQKLPGLLIWHIDESIITGGLASNSINSGAVEGMHLMQADGLEQLHAHSNRGDRGDSYPGLSNNHKLTYNTNPSATTNEGTVAGFVIDSIQQLSATGPVVFRFRRSAPYRVTTSAASFGGLVTVNGVSLAGYEELFGLGDTINISIPDTQVVNGGRTQLGFTSWSDAGARVHQVISDGTPDTVTATVGIKHRVNFIANGAGTIGTSGPATNTFVTTGTAVTLTATPNGGNSFTNWTGDTTSNNAVIALPMGRPYAVTANFTGAVAVTVDQATNAILLITPLTGPQATYLDAVGNNNGFYDLGDYLAYLKANGVVPAPGVLTNVMLRGARPLAAPTKKEQ